MRINHILTTVFIFISQSSYSQISDYLQSSTFDWTYWEIYDEDAEKKGFLDKSGLGNLSVAQVRIVDVDGDQSPDIISVVPNKLEIYLNSGSEFKKALELNQTLMAVGRPKPWHPIYLLTKNDNCCEAGYYSLNYYRPGYDAANDMVFVIDKSIIVQKDVELQNENLPPFRFELKIDLSLRVMADPQSTEIGNYTVTTHGYAVASKTGTDGKIWWLVLMPLEAHSLKAGWMPSTDLKRKF